MIRNRRYILSFWLLGLLFTCSTQTLVGYTKSIELFDSVVQVNKTGVLCVQETIVYKTAVPGHGIIRDFPTRSVDRFGNAVHVDFTVKKVLKDGVPVDYSIEPLANGKRIKIGNPAVYLSPGTYTYTLEYSTNRQLGLFEDHDELSWAVTGYVWNMPIEQARATLVLPSGIPSHAIQTAVFVGTENAPRYQDPIGVVEKRGNTIVAKTIQALEPYHGIRVFVEWPKGYIQEPAFVTKLARFLRDNLVGLWLVIGSILLLVYYAYVYRRVYTKPGVIIPLFTPPEGFSPQAVRFMVEKQYDNIAFSAEVVDLAVHGFLTIGYKEGFFKGTYTLTKNPEDDWSTQPTYEQKLLIDGLFKNTDELVLSQANGQHVARVAGHVAAYLDAKLNYKYIEPNSGYFGGGLALTGIIIAPALYFLTLGAFEILGIALLLLVNLVYYFLLQVYTPEGRALVDQIEGFKLFLATTETERLKVIGTPPTKSPELYEKYLPYAIALGVEKQWTKQFAPVFKHLEAQGQVYKPIWYSGNFQLGHVYFNPGLFTSTVAQTMPSYTYRTSGSKTAPGTYSDRKGGGSYGGGGGGGSW